MKDVAVAVVACLADKGVFCIGAVRFSLYCFFLAVVIARLHWYQIAFLIRASYSGPRASTTSMPGSIKSNDNHCCFHVSSGKYNNLPQELMDRIQELIPNAIHISILDLLLNDQNGLVGL
ncbi:hypothetical protein L1987_12939 [Smallanthus sonchifolius]|uniref:Uncharacterized protein n=1 Tax=Smallanthus sonchifolius TaxID=185202 RepID=A0ACB9JH86_9ASTR|nr:hypothetical protein L1987_12939 [Smallanthus sonchifolius]